MPHTLDIRRIAYSVYRHSATPRHEPRHSTIDDTPDAYYAMPCHMPCHIIFAAILFDYRTSRDIAFAAFHFRHY